jgi:hypothetical protein
VEYLFNDVSAVFVVLAENVRAHEGEYWHYVVENKIGDDFGERRQE